jgi:hypothetical protein
LMEDGSVKSYCNIISLSCRDLVRRAQLSSPAKDEVTTCSNQRD